MKDLVNAIRGIIWIVVVAFFVSVFTFSNRAKFPLEHGERTFL